MSLVKLADLDHVTFTVSDLEKSVKFYHDVFGFEIKEDYRNDASPWAIIGIPGKVYLCLYQAKTVPNENNTIMHWGFHIETSDAKALAETLSAQGVKVKTFEGSPDGVIDYGASDSIYILDPDGYSIELSTVHGGGLN